MSGLNDKELSGKALNDLKFVLICHYLLSWKGLMLAFETLLGVFTLTLILCLLQLLPMTIAFLLPPFAVVIVFGLLLYRILSLRPQ